MRLTYKDKELFLTKRPFTEMLNKLGRLEDLMDRYNIDNINDLNLEIRVNRDKVYKYESIEKELGIDLIIFIKSLQNGIYDKKRYYQGSCLSLSNGNIGLYINDLDRLFLFKDYGKTWALTKEELE